MPTSPVLATVSKLNSEKTKFIKMPIKFELNSISIMKE